MHLTLQSRLKAFCGSISTFSCNKMPLFVCLLVVVFFPESCQNRTEYWVGDTELSEQNTGLWTPYYQNRTLGWGHQTVRTEHWVGDIKLSEQNTGLGTPNCQNRSLGWGHQTVRTKHWVVDTKLSEQNTGLWTPYYQNRTQGCGHQAARIENNTWLWNPNYQSENRTEHLVLDTKQPEQNRTLGFGH